MQGFAPRKMLIHALSFLSALAAISAAVYFAFAALKTGFDLKQPWVYKEVFLKGWFLTLKIAALAMPLSVLLGLLFALARRSSFLPLHYASRIIVELTRGTPLLVQISLYFYIFGTVLKFDDRNLVGIFIVSAFAGAYMSEIIRSGIESVGRSQLESARAIGLTRFQTYRCIIFPQAIRQMLPPFAGQFVSLVKDSSLLSIIAVEEFTKASETAIVNTFALFESYTLLAIGYLIITLPISLWTQWLEKRVRYET